MLEGALLHELGIGAIRYLPSSDGPAARPPLQALGITE